jgi:translation initiation factor IF-1
MPQNRISKKTSRAQVHSQNYVKDAISSKSNQFARVEKVLGGKRFYVKFFDGEKMHINLLAKPRGLFSSDGRKRVNIALGDFVLLEGANLIKDTREAGKDIMLEIYGVLDPETARELFKTGIIHKAIYEDSQEEDDLFIFGHETEEGVLDITTI